MSTPINYFRNHLSFLGVTFNHVLAETTTERSSWKKLLQKIDKKKGEEW